ncbi:MAG: hypothetical protein R3C53_24810 [Pirellulaceae bacterium]
MWTIDPKISLGLWWALVAAGVAAIVWYSFRRDWPVPLARRLLLTALLLVGLMGPLLVALNPTWVQTIPPLPGNPMLSVLVDGTLSMRTEDVGDTGTGARWQRAMQIARQVEPQAGVEIRRQVFGDAVEPLPDNLSDATHAGGPGAWPRGHRTDLAAVLRQTTRSGSPLGHAVLIVSDGAHNAGTVQRVLQSARESNALATPIYTVTLGTSLGMKNMSLTAKNARMIAFPDNPITIRVNVGHNGLAGEATEVTLLRDDQVIQTQHIKLNAEPVQEVRFTLPDGVQSSIERYRISAAEVVGEVTTADNQTAVLVQRLNAPIGVLVLEGKPYWDSKFLSRNLAADPVVDLTAIVQLSPGRFLRRKVTVQRETEKPEDTLGAAAPQNPDDKSPAPRSDDWEIEKELDSPLESMALLESFRVVMLGRDAGTYLTDRAIENLRLWIAQTGGCLLCARGSPTDQVPNKLAEILPVRWVAADESHFRTKLSSHGFDSSVFDPLLSSGQDPLTALPSLSTGSIPKVRAGLPQILVESTVEGGDTSIPVVTYQPYGRGLSVVVEGAGMWRWAFLPPQHAEKDKIYPTLWQSMIQWIISQQDVMPGQEVAVRADRANFLSGDRATASVIVRDPQKWLTADGRLDLAVTVVAADEDLPRRLSLVAGGSEPGLYRTDFGDLPVGYYSVQVVAGEKDELLAATAFEVRDPWFESLEVDARPDIMRQIARLSGGEVLEPDDVGALAERFAEKLKQEKKHEEVRTTMWDNPLVLLLILVGWITTWVVRRQNGLV